MGNILKTIHKGTDPAHPGWTRTYSYNEPSLLDGSKKNNRLSSTTLDQVVEDYLHDAHGNIERMPHLASHGDKKKPNMRWDFEDQLCQVDLAGGGTAFYVYDAEGQRVRKVIHRQNGTRHKERIYLGEFEIYREYKGNGNDLKLERETLHVMDDEQRIALVETKTFELKEDGSGNKIEKPEPVIRYQLGNHLGSASLELDVNGEVISYEEYYPYGSTSYQAGRSKLEVSLKRYRYTGKERDEESCLSYHGARYYAVWLSRWISCDPSGLVDGLNLYAYVESNPLGALDLEGNTKQKIDKNKKNYQENQIIHLLFVGEEYRHKKRSVLAKTLQILLEKSGKWFNKGKIVLFTPLKTRLNQQKVSIRKFVRAMKRDFKGRFYEKKIDYSKRSEIKKAIASYSNAKIKTLVMSTHGERYQPGMEIFVPILTKIKNPFSNQIEPVYIAASFFKKLRFTSDAVALFLGCSTSQYASKFFQFTLVETYGIKGQVVETTTSKLSAGKIYHGELFPIHIRDHLKKFKFSLRPQGKEIIIKEMTWRNYLVLNLSRMLRQRASTISR